MRQCAWAARWIAWGGVTTPVAINEACAKASNITIAEDTDLATAHEGLSRSTFPCLASSSFRLRSLSNDITAQLAK